MAAVNRIGRLARGLGRHVFLVLPFVFYYWTAAPGIGSADTALVVDEAYQLNLRTHVNHHNLTLLLGRLFMLAPGSDLARLANLSSAFAGAVAIALFYLLVLRLSRSRVVASASAAILMVSHSMWWHSTIAEVYAVNAILTVCALLLLQRLARAHSDRVLMASFFLAGLAFFNHLQMGIILAGAGSYLVAHVALGRRAGGPWPYALVAGCALGFAIGFAPYAVTFAVDVWRAGDARTVVAQAVGAEFASVMAKGSPAQAIGDLLFLVALQFPTAFVLAIPYGLRLLYREWRTSPALLALSVVFVLNTSFFAFYGTWDKFAFLLPSFIVLAYAGSFALRDLYGSISARGATPGLLAFGILAGSCVATPPIIYSRLVSWAEWGGPFTRFRQQAGLIDTSAYRANPNKRHFRDFEDYVRRLLERLPPDAIYVDSDAGAYYQVLYFQRYRHLRPDVRPQLVNYLGIRGWGLDPDAFRTLLLDAYRLDRPLYLVAIKQPFYRLIVGGAGLDRLRFRPLALDERHTIYRLVGITDEAGSPQEPPAGAQLGTAADQETPLRRSWFSPRDRVFARLDFETNAEPFEAEFWWTPPGGDAPTRSRSAFVPFGCSGAWSELDHTQPLASGLWRVEVRSAGSSLASANFEVRAAEPVR